jgi:DNA-binding CsgD family transcriptional regulator
LFRGRVNPSTGPASHRTRGAQRAARPRAARPRAAPRLRLDVDVAPLGHPEEPEHVGRIGAQRVDARGRDLVLQRDGQNRRGQTPGCDDAAVDERDRTNDAVRRRDTVLAHERLERNPSEQQRIERAEEARLRECRARVASCEIDEAVGFSRFAGHGVEPESGVAQGHTCPLREVARVGRTVTGHVTKGQTRERLGTIERRRCFALREGAQGYLLKGTDPDAMVAALRGVLNGEPALSPGLAMRILDELRGDTSRRVFVPDRGNVSLTAREAEVLELLRQGLSTAAIGRQLFISPVTVRSHVAAVLKKLKADDRESALSLFRSGR